MGDCIVRLNQLIDQLSPAEARVARYLLDHCQEAIGQPIEKVSEACQTSKTTVVRLCKQLGFKGYKALSIALSMELASGGENRISYQDINPGDDIHTIIERVSQHTPGRHCGYRASAEGRGPPARGGCFGQGKTGRFLRVGHLRAGRT